MTKILLSLVTFISVQAFANPACLSQVTNNELANEVARRLGTGTNPGPGGNGAILTANCDSGGTLYLRTVNPDTGAKRSVQAYVGSTNCNAYVNSLIQVSNLGLSRNILVSHCDSGGTLYKTLVGIDGNMTSVSQDYVGSTSCQTTAIAANQRLQP